MPSPAGVISRRRVLQASMWATPAILVATAAPAAAASQPATAGGFLRITNVHLSNQNAAAQAGYNFDFEYSVYNDYAAFAGTGVEPWQAQSDPAFATWAVTWLFEIINNSGTVVASFTDNVVLTHGQGYNKPTALVTLPATGVHTARLTLTSNDVATMNGHTFSARTVTQSTASVTVN